MHSKLNIVRQNIYSFVFAILFFGMLLSPAFKSGWTLKTFDTSFKWRKELIHFYNFSRIKIGDRVFPTVVVGKDGWFFYTDKEAIDVYQKGKLVAQKDLRQLQQALDNLNKDLMQRGTILVVVIPPNKESVYPQYMPDEIPVLREKSRLDQFAEFMQLHAETRIIDLRYTMQEASAYQEVYFKTDTHWNQYGAYLAYEEILSVLSEDYPALRVHPLSDYKISLGSKTTRDMAYIIGVPSIQEADWEFYPKFSSNVTQIKVPVGINYIQISTTNDETLPSAVVIHDSFFISLSRFFEPHFNRILFAPFPEKGVWNLTWIEQEKPDVVIIELVERYLWYLSDLLSTQ